MSTVAIHSNRKIISSGANEGIKALFTQIQRIFPETAPR